MGEEGRKGRKGREKGERKEKKVNLCDYIHPPTREELKIYHYFPTESESYLFSVDKMRPRGGVFTPKNIEKQGYGMSHHIQFSTLKIPLFPPPPPSRSLRSEASL